MRSVTVKSVQTHFECVCGRNVVDHEEMKVRWKDLHKMGVVRRRDKTTGKPFLLQITKSEICTCNEPEP